jgi:hypothetical protein
MVSLVRHPRTFHPTNRQQPDEPEHVRGKEGGVAKENGVVREGNDSEASTSTYPPVRGHAPRKILPTLTTLKDCDRDTGFFFNFRTQLKC